MSAARSCWERKANRLALSSGGSCALGSDRGSREGPLPFFTPPFEPFQYGIFEVLLFWLYQLSEYSKTKSSANLAGGHFRLLKRLLFGTIV